MKSTLTLTTAARSAIVSAYVSALNTAENTGGLIHTVCDVVHRNTKGKPIGDDDAKAIVADIASAKGWKGPSAAARTSEVRIVLRAVDRLPEAIEAFRKKAHGCTWHNTMKMARGLAKGKSIAQCVKAAYEQGNGGEPVSPEGRVAGALKAWWKKSPRKRDAIIAAASTLGIKLGVKLDA